MGASRTGWMLLVAAACGPGAAPAVPVVAPASAAAPRSAGGDPPAPRAPRLTLEQAREYMARLVNRDRASMGLPAVALEDGPASSAARAHARDMAAHGFLGHWGTDGSVPEQRMTEAGGADMVTENASCYTDEAARRLDDDPEIDPASLDLVEGLFFRERPPNDGHRKNILRPWHTGIGIGIAQPVSTAVETAIPCVVEEFSDAYGTYAPIPTEVASGARLHVAGTVEAPASFAGVGLARRPRPHALGVGDVNARRSYWVPPPDTMYWPYGYRTPVPVKVMGRRFEVDVPVGGAGLDELSVWASLPGRTDLVMVSLRTFRVN